MVNTKLAMTGFLARVAFFSYVGMALIQWVHRTFGSAQAHSHANGAQEWLANGTAALPFVAGALWLAGRRAGDGSRTTSDVLRASLYAAAMGAVSLFTSPLADGTHDSTTSLGALAPHLGVALAAAAAFSLLVDRLEAAVEATAYRSEWRLARASWVSKTLVPLACL